MKMVDFIVCDDIRQEILSKITLVGIYSDKIVLPPNIVFPAKLKLGIYSKFHHEKSDPPFDGFKVVFHNNEQEIAKVDGFMNSNVPLEIPLVLNFVMAEFPILAQGEIRAKFSFLNKGAVVTEIQPAPIGVVVVETKQNPTPGAAIN